MFKNLLAFWKGRDFLSQVLEHFKEMLNDSQEMFESVCRKLINNEDIPSLEEKIYREDERVNKLEKDIRKRVIEHLSFQPAIDISACLLLMSVVKDAERLGDYSKNLFEVTQLLDKPINKDKYLKLFDNIEKKISELFARTKKAFIESDEAKAVSTWNYETEIVKRCDEIIEEVAKSNLPVNEAVCFTLIARYYKRISAHLTNIATSVILPLSELDYFDERRKDEEGDQYA
jgi:phosphate uptake regulator